MNSFVTAYALVWLILAVYVTRLTLAERRMGREAGAGNEGAQRDA
jgi:hypothetical protein